MYFLELLIPGNRKCPNYLTDMTKSHLWVSVSESLKLCKVQKRVKGAAHTIVAKSEKLKTLSACEPFCLFRLEKKLKSYK